ALAFLVMVVVLMAFFEDTRIALYIGPPFILLLTVLYYAFNLAPKVAMEVTQTNTFSGTR
ncbi:hypothetical protein ACV367_32860, partial [Pseudomonas aeruginosa]